VQRTLAQCTRECVSKSVEDSLLDVAMPNMVDTPIDAVLHKSRRFYCTWEVKVCFNR